MPPSAASGPSRLPEAAGSILARHLTGQAEACRTLDSPLYADLLTHAAADVVAGGPLADLLSTAGHLRGQDLLALRLLGGVHALVLTRQAPELAMYYPSVGGQADPGHNGDAAWPAFRTVVETYAGTLAEWLTMPPQTNEVGRASALLGGLCLLGKAHGLPVRLVEMGASAGLTLRAEGFAVTGTSHLGDPGSPVCLDGAWLGDPLPTEALPSVLDRVAGDLAPVDPHSTAGWLRLTAYVWADQRGRLERLRGALSLVDRIPVTMHAEPAIDTVERWGPKPGTLGVLWQSVFEQYLSADDRHALERRVAEIGTTATRTAPLARISYEPDTTRGERCAVVLTTWPTGESVVLGTGQPHGIPLTWDLADWRAAAT